MHVDESKKWFILYYPLHHLLLRFTNSAEDNIITIHVHIETISSVYDEHLVLIGWLFVVDSEFISGAFISGVFDLEGTLAFRKYSAFFTDKTVTFNFLSHT